MQENTLRRIVCAAAILSLGILAGCGDDPQPVAPGLQPEIINSVDNFQFQVTAVTNYTGILDYPWSNTGAAADVNQSCAVGSGAVVLTLLDDTGAEVYSRDLNQDGSFPSNTGSSGSWTIRVALYKATGDLNFRVDKRTP